MKHAIYHVDSLPGGEIGIQDNTALDYLVKEDLIYNKQDEVKGKIVDGKNFSEYTLELHVFDDPSLEKLIDDCRIRNSHS